MNTIIPNDPRALTALRTIRVLACSYIALCVLTLVAIVLLRDTDAVNDAVWIRGVVLAAVSLLTYSFVAGAARGSGRALLRLRIASAVQVVAIAVILAVPGPFPVWLKIEQGVCGLLLIAVVVVAGGRHLRSSLAAR